MKVMNTEEIYFAEQEYKEFERIMNTQLYLTKEEYDFVFMYDKDVREDITYVGFSEDKYYLNLGLYSEHDHEKRQYEIETA